MFAYTRSLDGESLLIVANMVSEPTPLPATGLPDLTGAQLVLGTHPEGSGQTLAAWESRIYRLG